MAVTQGGDGGNHRITADLIFRVCLEQGIFHHKKGWKRFKHIYLQLCTCLLGRSSKVFLNKEKRHKLKDNTVNKGKPWV